MRGPCSFRARPSMKRRTASSAPGTTCCEKPESIPRRCGLTGSGLGIGSWKNSGDTTPKGNFLTALTCVVADLILSSPQTPSSAPGGRPLKRPDWKRSHRPRPNGIVAKWSHGFENVPSKENRSSPGRCIERTAPSGNQQSDSIWHHGQFSFAILATPIVDIGSGAFSCPTGPFCPPQASRLASLQLDPDSRVLRGGP
jgi:hypothetical protein